MASVKEAGGGALESDLCRTVRASMRGNEPPRLELTDEPVVRRKAITLRGLFSLRVRVR